MGSFGVDVDIRFNTASAVKSATEFSAKYKKLMEDAAAGVAGSAEKAQKALESYSKGVVSSATREGKALETSMRTVARQAEMAGKTISEQILIRRDRHLEVAKAAGKEADAVKKLAADYQKLYDVQKKAEDEAKKGGHGGSTGNLVFRGVRDIFEGRTAYGAMDLLNAGKIAAGGSAGGGLAGISAATLAVTGFGVALAATAVAGYKAAESMGEYAVHVHEIQVATGMSTAEVQKLEIASKMSGRSVEEIVHAMRPLTQVLEGHGAAAERGAKAFRDLGGDIVGVREHTVTLYQAMTQMGEALRKNPDNFKKNAEMIDIFKKIGIDLITTLENLNEAEEMSGRIHIFTDKQFDDMMKARKAVEAIQIEAGRLFQQLELLGSKTFVIVVKYVVQTAGAVDTTTGVMKGLARMGLGALGIDVFKPEEAPKPPTATEVGDFAAKRARFEQLIGGGTGLEAEERKLQALQKGWNLLHEDTDTNFADFRKGTEAWVAKLKLATDELRAQKLLVEAMRKAESTRQSLPDRERQLTKTTAETVAAAFSKDKSEGIFGPYNKAIADIAASRAAQPSLTPGMERSYQEQQFAAAQTLWLRAQESMRKYWDLALEGAQPMAEIEAGRVKKIKEEHAEMVSTGVLSELMKPTSSTVPVGYETGEHKLKSIADQERRSLGLFGASATMAGLSPKQTAAAEYQMKVSYAEAYYEQEKANNQNLIDEAKRNEDALQRAQEKRYDAAMEYEQKLAEIQAKLYEQIKSTTESLAHTLFTRPGEFGGQLKTTLRDAALKPVESMIGTAAATFLTPILGRASDALSSIRPLDGTMPVTVVNDHSGRFGGGGMMPAGTGIFSTSPFGSGTFGGFGGPGGTPGFAPGSLGLGGGGLWDLPLASQMGNPALYPGMAGGGGAPFGSPGSAGGGGGHGFMNPLAALGQKGIGFLGKYLIGSPGGAGFTQAGGGSVIGSTFGGYAGALGSGAASAAQRLKALSAGPFAGTPAGPAAAGVGIALASQGIFGEQRGRAGGIAEATAGGFLVAGPVGAAIGFGIGVGEMVAGVESPRYEAKRLVKMLYRIEINNSTADQIVSIAKQSYAGHVSIAVRSPEVRHMLGLYAAGTGQGSMFAQSANEPHGASLVESGGTLQQQATYQYGQAYTYRSSLPVLGNIPTNPLGAPGGGVNLSLNIGGTDAARFLQGNVVSPDVVSSQYAMAMSGSNGRVNQALMMSAPGSIAS